MGFFPLRLRLRGGRDQPRAVRDVAEGKSEIVAGFHVEYSGMAFALFFLAEYANMILISALTATFFFGGWQGPLEGYPGPWLISSGSRASCGSGSRCSVLLFLFLWFRATFPRYRFDQIMRLGWKALIPVTLVCGSAWRCCLRNVGRSNPGRGRGFTDRPNGCP